MTEVLHHYVYKIEFETGHFYFGSRSSECEPEQDSYLGSPVTHKTHWEQHDPKKTVLMKLDTREEASEYENVLIEWGWDVCKNLSLNACNYGVAGPKYNPRGRKRTTESIEKFRSSISRPFTIVSPTGEVIVGRNLHQFCKDNNLHSSPTYQLLKGNFLHLCGWTASLNCHKLYLEGFDMRGIKWQPKKNRWQLTYLENKKRVSRIFKNLEEAKERRQHLLDSGIKFRVEVKNWKEKLKEINEK
jgi:hypothetical protein